MSDDAMGRACQLWEKLKEIKPEDFQFSGGYLAQKVGESCHGCAIGSVAFAMGLRPDVEIRDHEMHYLRCGAQVDDVNKIVHNYVTEHQGQGGWPAITREEQMQLEMGYEGWRRLYMDGRKYEQDKASPFFQCGQRLAEKAGY